jgi:hypothetical protein
MIRTVFVIAVLACFLWERGAPGDATPVAHVAQVTSYNQMVRELASDSRHCLLVRVSTIGHSAKYRRAILLVQLGVSGIKTAKILVLCRQHGDEPSGTEGALALINKLAYRPDIAKLLRFACLYIVPMVNPDGAEAGTRLNGEKADLNRDWGIFHQPETAAVRNVVRKLRPAFILDIHSWDMIDPFQQVCLEGPRGDGVSPKLLWAVAELQARAAYGLSAISKQSVLATTYGQYSEPTLAHRYFMKTDRIASLLFETAPGPNFGESLAKRTALVELLLSWLIKDTSLHRDSWQRLAQAEPSAPVDSEAARQHKVTGQSDLQGLSIEIPWFQLWFGCLVLMWILFRKRSSSDLPEAWTGSRFRRAAAAHVCVTKFASPDLKDRRRQSAEILATPKPAGVRKDIKLTGHGRQTVRAA